MELELKIIGFKEDASKEKTVYYPLDIDEFMKDNILYDRRHRYTNTFSTYDAILSDSDLLLAEDNCLCLDDFNASDKGISHDTPYFNGLIQAGFICVTSDNAIFKNIYLTRLNKLNILTHQRVRANFVIKKKVKDNIYSVML